MTATDRGHVEEIINHLKKVENDYRINLTEEMEWLRKLVKEEHVSDDLEKEIEQYCIHHGYLDSFKDCGYTFNEQVGDIARHFAEWQRKKMVAQAVEGEVVMSRDGRLFAAIPLSGQEYEFGDKIKGIVL